MLPLSCAEDYLLVLADGMGGHQGGAEAAQRVIDTALESATTVSIPDPGAFLDSICRDAHREISRNRPGAGRRAPGSTCVLLYLHGDEAYWVHVGDSRLSYIRRRSLIRETVDHSMRQLAAVGGGDQRSVLYMCLGGSVTPRPPLDFLSVDEGDLIALSSDGFWEQVATEEVIAHARRHGVQHNTAAELVETARGRGGHGADNISLVLAQRR